MDGRGAGGQVSGHVEVAGGAASESELEQDAIDAAWNEEVGRRLEEILNGKVELVSGEETMRIAQRMIDESQSAR